MSLNRTDLPEHHLKYEVDMLLHLTTFQLNLIQGGRYNNQYLDVLNNAILESYLVHVRNIKDSLWETGHKDDISAKSFCSNDCSRQGTKSEDTLASLNICQVNRRINKQISHLTRERKERTREEMTWDVEKITCDLTSYLETFISNADKIDKEYREAIKQELSEFKSAYCLSSAPMTKPIVLSNSTTALTVTVSFSPGEYLKVVKDKIDGEGVNQ